MKNANPHENLNNDDVSFLIGKAVEQLALGQYEFQINFNDEVSISIHQTLIVTTETYSMEIRADRTDQTKELYFLLGHKVDGAAIDSTKTLKLIFDDLATISISATKNAYDSYLIWNKGEYIAA